MGIGSLCMKMYEKTKYPDKNILKNISYNIKILRLNLTVFHFFYFVLKCLEEGGNVILKFWGD